MKIKKKIKKKSGSKTEILRNVEAQPKRLVSYKKKQKKTVYLLAFSHKILGGGGIRKTCNLNILVSINIDEEMRYSTFNLYDCLS